MAASLGLGLALGACGGDASEGAPGLGSPQGEEPVAIKPIRASTVAVTLESLGLDLANLPTLHETVERLEAEDEERVHTLMDTFTKSLGVRCSACHTVRNAEGRLDFEADTPERRVATKMWDVFLRTMKSSDGTPLYCDSCHQGSLEALDRSDGAQLRADMRTVFVDGLVTTNEQAVRCATCHGDPFDPDFLDSWAE